MKHHALLTIALFLIALLGVACFTITMVAAITHRKNNRAAIMQPSNLFWLYVGLAAIVLSGAALFLWGTQ